MSDEIKATSEPKLKTHRAISVKLSTIAKIEEYRKYERETYDEILSRWYAAVESRKGKKKGDEEWKTLGNQLIGTV